MMHHSHAIKRNRGFPPFGVAIACRHNIPRCPLPPRPAARGCGPRLWQSPAAALRPAGRPKLAENTLHPICHSSFVIFASVRSVSLRRKSVFHLCCEADVRLCGLESGQTQSNPVKPSIGGGDSLSPQHPPAGRPKRTENTLYPICHSSLISPIQ